MSATDAKSEPVASLDAICTPRQNYETVRSESRQGFDTTPAGLNRIDNVIAPLVKQGQSIYQICANNTDLIMLDERTIYNYCKFQ